MKFDPASYIRSWLAKGQHGTLDTKSKSQGREEKNLIGNHFETCFKILLSNLFAVIQILLLKQLYCTVAINYRNYKHILVKIPFLF
jgi:hypothetical protein